jgi:hypothetical protein
MANKGKLGQNIFTKVNRARGVEVNSIRKYMLIVCEGEATEPNYFEGLKQSLPAGMLTHHIIKIKGTGMNTESLVKRALAYKLEIEQASIFVIDKVWVVFDRDSFKEQQFNQAVTSCLQAENVDCAWSNEAFELWYLLHFEYHDTAITRAQYQKKLEAYCKKIKGQGGFTYQKNRADMYQLLESRMSTAIKHAKRLKATHIGTGYAKHKPCTTVHELIIELRAWQAKYEEGNKP